MPSLSSFMSFRIARRNTHMPDCESRTQRKNSTDMASESTRLPNLCLKLMARAIAHREARGVQEIHVQVEEGLDQVGERVHRIAVVAIERDDQVAGGVGEAALVGCGRSRALPRASPWRRATAATSLVRSVELLSTTIDLVHELRHGAQDRSIPCSSLRQGMITVIDCPLYMRVRLRLFSPAPRLDIMDCMKRLAILVSLRWRRSPPAAELSDVHNVYLLKMSKGSTSIWPTSSPAGKVFQVVTDPKLADAVFTEQIGEGFEAKLDELFPPPEAEKPEPPPKPEKPEKPEKDARLRRTDEDTGRRHPDDRYGQQADQSGVNSSFGRAKGTMFLVDAKSKQVIWSAFELPKDATSRAIGPHGLRHCKPHQAAT